MPRKLIVCCDGTWNNPTNVGSSDGYSDVAIPTNVFRLASLLDVAKPKEGEAQDEQLLGYISGMWDVISK